MRETAGESMSDEESRVKTACNASLLCSDF